VAYGRYTWATCSASSWDIAIFCFWDGGCPPPWIIEIKIFNVHGLQTSRTRSVFVRAILLYPGPLQALVVYDDNAVYEWIGVLIRHGTMDHILWPSDPGIQRSGDPVDPVTQFYNELQMSTYVADKRLQWSRSLPVFIAVWRLHTSGKWNFEHHLLNINISLTVRRILTKIYIYIYIYISLYLHLGFSRKLEKLGSHTGSKWWPSDPMT